jgi:hypothetical protein
MVHFAGVRHVPLVVLEEVVRDAVLCTQRARPVVALQVAAQLIVAEEDPLWPAVRARRVLAQRDRRVAVVHVP